MNTEILEKILTLNINANTNVDLEQLVAKYMMFDTIAKVMPRLIGAVAIGVVAVIVFILVKKGLENESKRTEIEGQAEMLDKVMDRVVCQYDFESYQQVKGFTEGVLKTIFKKDEK